MCYQTRDLTCDIFGSGWDGKNVDVTQKIITSQSKVARLRSRFLRCITQVLTDSQACKFNENNLSWLAIVINKNFSVWCQNCEGDDNDDDDNYNIN